MDMKLYGNHMERENAPLTSKILAMMEMKLYGNGIELDYALPT